MHLALGLLIVRPRQVRENERTGEAGTKRICLAFQFVADFKGGCFTARTQNSAISDALIELTGIERKK